MIDKGMEIETVLKAMDSVSKKSLDNNGQLANLLSNYIEKNRLKRFRTKDMIRFVYCTDDDLINLLRDYITELLIEMHKNNQEEIKRLDEKIKSNEIEIMYDEIETEAIEESYETGYSIENQNLLQLIRDKCYFGSNIDSDLRFIWKENRKNLSLKYKKPKNIL